MTLVDLVSEFHRLHTSGCFVIYDQISTPRTRLAK